MPSRSGPNPYRRRLPDEIISELEQRLCTNADMTGGNAAEREFLATKGYFPVHDVRALNATSWFVWKRTTRYEI